jgi:hypothetical protein
MDFAIHFNYQLQFLAEKIDDESLDNLLPTKFEAHEILISQLLPEGIFGFGHSGPESSCLLDLSLVDTLLENDTRCFHKSLSIN